MTEPVTTNATAATVGVALLSLFPGVDAAVVMGAFAGAGVFVLASDDLVPLKRGAFFLLSFVAGCLAARLCADLISWGLPERIQVNPAVGALVASAVSIKLLLWLIRRAENPDKLVDSFKGGPKS
ncbi:hypothetical protein DBB29_02985 [Pandoraea cepalis]|uniref:Phage holin n=1 Tax=Pandoraea cepalis TaxID=2508294 RepID=A0AAW7MJ77_9BURK|nr:phage holin family protein [Pandoraea cepalis]MDN4572670.1 hypothetical protein [Pandoraea cepalis]MDN4577085.1 hypothetical protein [Pandoraea cepalis]